MYERIRRAAAIGSIILVASACGGSSPAASTPPAATSYEEYATAACAAWDSLFRAVGNPDTASGSELSKALDAAVEAGDPASAERVAATMTAELETGRGHVAVAASWQPAAATMSQLDRVFVAFEAMTEAKRLASRGGADSAAAQAAFEKAGGVEAWFAMFEAAKSIPGAGTASRKPCPTVPVTP